MMQSTERFVLQNLIEIINLPFCPCIQRLNLLTRLTAERVGSNLQFLYASWYNVRETKQRYIILTRLRPIDCMMIKLKMTEVFELLQSLPNGVRMIRRRMLAFEYGGSHFQHSQVRSVFR